ncbi:hypothetical protein FGO68_gene14269 [Halteria grandinella]|uniref:Uncharacterized protein n=1 Tax=Halteria grandinella TaxID=5974 RepID=A0A8J8NL31_HALGN|nr:hypothetical protein FGO68_gene14269 [Halteria grandinella]
MLRQVNSYLQEVPNLQAGDFFCLWKEDPRVQLLGAGVARIEVSTILWPKPIPIIAPQGFQQSCRTIFLTSSLLRALNNGIVFFREVKHLL